MTTDFSAIHKTYDWSLLAESIYNKTSKDVQRALENRHVDLEDFKALISPAAQPFLESMAQKSQKITQSRFGKTIQMYVPLYLSNECQNICTYCGFSLNIDIPRKTLTPDEIHTEAKHLRDLGYHHVLVVTGEANKSVGMPYFLEALEILKQYFSQISFEVQPLETKEYIELKKRGVYSILVYQETYRQDEYKKHHPKGKKSNFLYRLKTPDRIGNAEIDRVGLGVLIGLEDWRVDSFFTALHLSYLEKTYWRSKYSISFPRLRPCANGIDLKSVMSDKELLQLICAYRIFNAQVELSLSTRESEVFRNNAFALGITSISAESSTNPGGYVVNKDSLKQFDVHDTRSTKEYISVIKSKGYDPVFKDWDAVLYDQ